MIRLIKKWWILRHLKKDCIGHTIQQIPQFALNNQIFVSKDAVIEGLAKNSVRRFSWIPYWRAKDNPKKLSKRIQEYASIIAFCIGTDKFIKQKIRSDGMVVIRTTSLGDDFTMSTLLETILSKYKLLWGIIVSISGIVWLFGRYIYNWIVSYFLT